MKGLLAVAVSILSFAAFAQTTTTHCMTTTEEVMKGVTAKVLVACAPSFPENTLWHLDRLDQISPSLNGTAWRGRGGAGSVIYVVDSGVYAAHDEFMTAAGSRVIAGINITQIFVVPCNTSDKVLDPCAGTPSDLALNSHGTAAASAAAGKNVGVAPQAWIVAVKVVDPFYMTTTRDFDNALDAIIENAFDPRTPQFSTGIVTMSVGTNVEEPPVTYAAVTAKMQRMTTGVDREGNSDPNGKKFFFSISAFNNFAKVFCDPGGPTKVWPATEAAHIDGVVAVGGTSRDSDSIWSGSCLGAELYAPAEHILVALSSGRNQYRSDTWDSGTSWSAPIVAGIAARMLEVSPALTPAEIEARLIAGAVPVGTSNAKEPLFLPPPPRVRAIRH
jgi:subtilisin family serine protease